MPRLERPTSQGARGQDQQEWLQEPRHRRPPGVGRRNMAPAVSPRSATEGSDPSDMPDREAADELSAATRLLDEQAAALHDLRCRLRAEVEGRGRIEQALRDSEARARRAESAWAKRSRAFLTASCSGTPTIAWSSPTSATATSIPSSHRHPPGCQLHRAGRCWRRAAASPRRSGARTAWVAERVRQRARATGRGRSSAGSPTAVGCASPAVAPPRAASSRSTATLPSSSARPRSCATREAQLRGIVDNIPGVVYRRIRHPDGRISYPYHSPQIELRHGFDSAAVAEDAIAAPGRRASRRPRRLARGDRGRRRGG